MWPAFVLVVVMALLALLVDLTVKIDGRTDQLRDRRASTEMARVAEGIDRYVVENGVAPASLDALAATPGYEEVRGHRNQWQAYSASGAISDGTWRFQRAAAWTVARRDGGAGYGSENACGVGSVSTAASWCGARDGTWYRNESRETYAKELAQQRVRQNRTLQLLADYYTAKQAFPRTGNDGATLAVGQMRALPQLAGFSGNARSCSGVYVWQGIPLDCSALFDVWGNPVGYQYQSDSYIVLASESTIQTAAGDAVIVATPLQVQE